METAWKLIKIAEWMNAEKVIAAVFFAFSGLNSPLKFGRRFGWVTQTFCSICERQLSCNTKEMDFFFCFLSMQTLCTANDNCWHSCAVLPKGLSLCGSRVWGKGALHHSAFFILGRCSVLLSGFSAALRRVVVSLHISLGCRNKDKMCSAFSN